MLHISRYTNTLYHKLLLVGGLLLLIASCTSENNNDATEAEDYVILPKEEMLLSINSQNVSTAEGTRAVGYNMQDSTFADGTTIGLYIISEERYNDPMGYMEKRKQKDSIKYTYGNDGDVYNDPDGSDGYDNLMVIPNNTTHELSLGTTIFYPWGKSATNIEAGRVALIAYSPWNGAMGLEEMEDPAKNNGQYVFSVRKDQRDSLAVLKSDLLIGNSFNNKDNPDSVYYNCFRSPRKTVNVRMKHVLSKLSLTTVLTPTDTVLYDSTKVTVKNTCDSIKIYVKNVSTDASVNFFHFNGIESIKIRNKNTSADIGSSNVLLPDTAATLIPCNSTVYKPTGEVFMGMIKSDDGQKLLSSKALSFTTSAIVIPGYVPDLQFVIRFYGVTKGTKDVRNFDYDENGHQYAEYTPRPTLMENKTPVLECGAHYKFKFTSAKITDPGTDMNIDMDETHDQHWVVGSKDNN